MTDEREVLTSPARFGIADKLREERERERKKQQRKFDRRTELGMLFIMTALATGIVLAASSAAWLLWELIK